MASNQYSLATHRRSHSRTWHFLLLSDPLSVVKKHVLERPLLRDVLLAHTSFRKRETERLALRLSVVTMRRFSEVVGNGSPWDSAVVGYGGGSRGRCTSGSGAPKPLEPDPELEDEESSLREIAKCLLEN